jgi:hypothetical protein
VHLFLLSRRKGFEKCGVEVRGREAAEGFIYPYLPAVHVLCAENSLSNGNLVVTSHTVSLESFHSPRNHITYAKQKGQLRHS